MNTYNITFPFEDNYEENSFLLMNQTSKTAYSSNLLLLLLTVKGERYNDPDYGTDLIKYIFEPNDDLTSQEVENEIKNTVSLYIPEIKINSILFNWLTDDNGNEISENQLSVDVKFTYNDDTLSEEGSLNLVF